MVYKEIFKIQICEYLNYKHLYSKNRENSKSPNNVGFDRIDFGNKV